MTKLLKLRNCLPASKKEYAELGKLSSLVEKQAAAKKPVDKFDQQIRELLGAYQKSAAAEKPSEEQQKKLAELKDQLRTLLNSQLQERQKSETSELKQLRDRLEKLQKEIDERLQNREGVIDRRLEQLLSAKPQEFYYVGPPIDVILDKQNQAIPQAVPAPAKLKSSSVPALPKAVTAPAVPAIPAVEPITPEPAVQSLAPAVSPVPVEREPPK